MSVDFARIRWALRGLPEYRLARTLYQISTHTMTRPIRCRALWKLCKSALQQEIPGDFVECGVWKGGSAGLMAATIKHFSKNHQTKIHLFDSFEGLPEPSEDDGIQASEYWENTRNSKNDEIHRCKSGTEHVTQLLQNRLRFPENRTVIHKGWFKDTIAGLGMEPRSIAVLRLDGDWYESTKICLDHLYDRVSPDGVVFLDDYFCWEGCRKATDEFRESRGIVQPIVRIDSDSGYWIKK